VVYPVVYKGGPLIVDPEGPHNGQNEGEASWEEAQHLVGEAHGLGRAKRRVPQLQHAIAGGQRLFKALVLSNYILFKNNFSFSANNNTK